jgi:Zn-dependent M28 family amino/carboxypeptidase
MVSTENVAAIIKGSEFPDEYIVLTSHLDHIGIEGGQINNGADDDGSGTVTMLEIAEALQIGLENGFSPKRSIVFLHVTGEEEGLLGSAYYNENPLYPLQQTIVNLNIDMIGRNDSLHDSDEDYLYLIGSDILSQDLHDISISINKRYSNLDLDFRYNDPLLKVYERGRHYANRYYYRSDHYNFAKNDIPVIFYFSGTHDDYHLPTDTVEKINYPLLAKRARFIFHTLWELANREDRIRLNSNKKYLNIDKNGR